MLGHAREVMSVEQTNEGDDLNTKHDWGMLWGHNQKIVWNMLLAKMEETDRMKNTAIREPNVPEGTSRCPALRWH